MTATVEVVDSTWSVPDHEAVRALVTAVLEVEGRDGEVAVAFVDEAAIAGLNARYRDVEGPTDVLAFDYSQETEWPGVATGAAQTAGEVVVCPQVVRRYAAEEGHEVQFQLGWTLIHGALHLAGYDHETDQGQMRAREQELLVDLAPQVRALSLTNDNV